MFGGGAAEVLKIKCFLHSVFFAEDVGDEGEEEKEFISYSISNDIHYGIKSNRWVSKIDLDIFTLLKQNLRKQAGDQYLLVLRAVCLVRWGSGFSAGGLW